MNQSGAIIGRGLFTGREASIDFGPGIGMGFRVAGRTIPAGVAHVVAATGPLGGRSTNIQHTGVSALTIEHALSALAGLNLWDATVELAATSADAPSIEVPIMDGSALEFVRAIDAVKAAFTGTRSQAVDASRTIRIERVIRVEDPKTGAFIEAIPSDTLRYRYELSYPPGSGIGDQAAEWLGDAADYRDNIAPARTFCLEREALAMRAAGLFTHLTPREMVVIAPDGRAIDNELRFSNEPARHKLLDLIGDLALLGGRLIADVRAVRSGHALTHEFGRQVLEKA